jgi:hypothetical protein
MATRPDKEGCTVSRRIIRDDATLGTINPAFQPVVNECYRRMMAANMAEPYVPEDYDMWDEMLKAALVLLVSADMPYARALRRGFLEGADHVDSLLSQWTRNVLCRDAGEMSQEEYDATLRFALECNEQGATWTEAYETRVEAESVAASYGDTVVTKIVDRHPASDVVGR